MVCGRLFSERVKSSLVRPWTSPPLLLRTVANTLTTLTSVEKEGASWPLMRGHGHNAEAAASKKRRLPQRPLANGLRFVIPVGVPLASRGDTFRGAQPRPSFGLSFACGAGGTYSWLSVFPS